MTFFQLVCKSLSPISEQFGFVPIEAVLFPEEGTNLSTGNIQGVLVLFDSGIPQQPKNAALKNDINLNVLVTITWMN